MIGLPCIFCRKEMPGVFSIKIRQRCYECGGHSYVRERDSHVTLENLKKAGLIEQTYQFMSIMTS